MQASARSANVLAVRRWRTNTPALEGNDSSGPELSEGGSDNTRIEERLLLVNFGTTDARVDDFGGDWHVLLDSGQPTQVDASGVKVALRSATILARDRDQV